MDTVTSDMLPQQICYELIHCGCKKRNAQGIAKVAERVWYAQLSATAAGPATRIPNSDGI